MKLRRVIVVAASLLLAVTGVAIAGNFAWLGIEGSAPSVCHGDVVNGSLENGRRLPYSGSNYRAYSLFGFTIGRTFVHGSVRDTVRDAFAELDKTHPELRFVYAESGWPWGGRFSPHKTHANGTSVDFLVPVRSGDGKVSELPTNPLNLFGYGVEVDTTGHAGTQAVDFDAIGEHLLALDKAARANRIRIRRVIFDTRLQPRLAKSKAGAAAMDRLSFNDRQAWVPHDEHYHVDFDVPCR